jgi:hypothetical protein
MTETTITVTEAARNFADCVNRSQYQNMTFLLVKNGVLVARLVPVGRLVCRGRDLAAALTSTKLREKEAWVGTVTSRPLA